MQMLPRTRPESLDDLTVQVALVRPGPIQGGAVHPYLERRERLRKDPSFRVPYEHPSLEPILRDTLGTIVFQEQVIQVAMALAGFSAGEAEGLRRAMSRKRSEEAILAYRDQFIAGARERGATQEVAERVFEQIRGFSGFGFPKAHAVAFGLLAYQSTWLRVHYGPEFLCSLLNEQPMGFYPPDALVHEAQRRGIEVLPPDVNRSGVECRRVPRASSAVCVDRPGLHNRAAGGGRPGAGRGARARRPLRGPRRPRLALRRRPRGARAARLGGGVRGDRRRRRPAPARGPVAARRRAGRTAAGPRTAASDGDAGAAPAQLSLPLPIPAAPSLRELDSWERLVADYASTGIAIAEHPMALLRPSLERGRALERRPRADRPTAAPVEVAGMVVARQRPGDRARGRLHAARGRAGDGQRGRPAARLRAPSPGREDGVVRAGERASWSGARGSSTWSPRPCEPLATPDLPRADVRQIEPPVGARDGRRDAAPAAVPRHCRPRRRRARRAQLRPARAVSGPCTMQRSVAERYVPSGPLPTSPPCSTGATLGQRMISGVDLAIDFATLGEYGLEPMPADGSCRERTGRRSRPSRRPDGRRSRRPAAAPAGHRSSAPARAARRVALPGSASRRADFRSAVERYAPTARHPARPPERSRPRGGFVEVKDRRRPTLPGSCPPSTIGAEGLNGSVRNGKRCFPLAMATENRSRPRGPGEA